MEKITKKEALKLLNLVKTSCKEGLDQTWDCSTAEGRESFEPMIDDLDIIIQYVKGLPS